jgi:VWFA-related protein
MAMKRYTIAILIFSILNVQLFAQEIEESSRVLLREVRMHIVDKDGNHVPGLKPSDFTIEEDGQTYQLTFFEEVDRSKPAPKEAELAQEEGVQGFSDSHQRGPRKLTLIIDTANLSYHYYTEMVKNLETFIFEKVDPQTQIQIIQVDGEIYPLTGYTPDRNQLREALNKMEYRGSLIKQLTALETSILNTVNNAITLLAANNFSSAGGLASPSGELIPLPNENSQDNGAAFKHSVDLDVRQKAYFKQLHYRKFTVQMLRIAHAMRGGTGAQSVLLVTGGQFIEEYGLYPRSVSVAETLSQAYNGVGIPLFIHLTKPKQALMENKARIQGNLGVAGGRGFAWDYDSLSQASTFDPTRGDRIRLGPYRSTVTENLYHMEGAPKYAAEWTGGQLTIDNNVSSITGRLETLFDAAGKYYRLGYTRFIDEEQSVVKTNITVRNAEENNWEVRYGKEALPTYGLDDRPDTQQVDDIPENPIEAISKTLHQGAPTTNDLAITQGFYQFPKLGDKLRIPVYMRLPKPVTPAESGYEFGFAALDGQGALLDHTVFALDYGFDNESILIYDVLMPQTRPSELRYFIREIGGDAQSFQTIKFEAPEEAGISELLLSDNSSSHFLLAPHHVRHQDADRVAGDPMILPENSMFPFVPGDLVFDKPQALRFFFTLNDGRQGNQITFELWLEDKDEEELLPPHQIQMLPYEEDGHKRFQGMIEAKDIPPGNYQLYVRVMDDANETEFEQTKPFAVVWSDTN